MLISELLDPKIDYVLKRIFGYTGNEEITQGLISSILRKEVSNVELDCETILEKDLLDDKVGIMDIRARIDNKVNCNIEMQIIDKKNIEKRILFYWSKLYNSSIKSGEDYDQLEKGIVILISDYELESLKEIRKYITKWNIREEDYQKIILTDALEFYIIELPKFEKYQDKIDNKDLSSWIKFINCPEVVSMEETNKQVQKAKKVLEEISNDKRERYLAELRQKYIMDQKAIEGAGYDKGVKAGIVQVARKLKQQKIDIDTISEVTGLPKEEILALD